MEQLGEARGEARVELVGALDGGNAALVASGLGHVLLGEHPGSTPAEALAIGLATGFASVCRPDQGKHQRCSQEHRACLDRRAVQKLRGRARVWAVDRALCPLPADVCFHPKLLKVIAQSRPRRSHTNRLHRHLRLCRHLSRQANHAPVPSRHRANQHHTLPPCSACLNLDLRFRRVVHERA
mgnify:CR=1 FL=1